MKKILLYISFFLIFIACNNEEVKQIEHINALIDNIDNDVTVFDDFSLVKLETNDSCLLENIIKADVQNDIYILSSYGGNIYKFAKDGRFVWKLKQGNGPGELIFATDFYIDYIDELIYVLDNYRELKVYSLDGDYIKSDKLPNLAFLFQKKNNCFLLFDPNLMKKSDFNFYVLKEGAVLKKGLKKDDNSRNVGFMPSSVFVNYSSNQCYIQHMLSDTIYKYSLSDNILEPAYYINTNGLSINSQNIYFSNSRSFYKMCKDRNLIPGVAGLSILGDKLYLTMFYDGHPFYVIYDKKNKETVISDQLCKRFPNSIHCVGRNGNSVIYSYDVEELYQYCTKKHQVDKRLVQFMKSVNLEDNPVLVIFK